jgi:hypothetical protein
VTEREYIETIKAAAKRYQKVILKETLEWTDRDRKVVHRWDTIREALSSSTVIKMADAWLEKNGDGS